MSQMDKAVSVASETYEKLAYLAEKDGASISEVLARAIDNLYRKRFLEDMNADYARLRADAEAWKEELEERALWDNTLNDGLEDM
jgi:predicted CopG family antitoxin